ncbi:sulfatase-like hydrolase/transferase [Halorarius litoreus]|uniref:sulfatase-like hydrolase/transferase n=1 Tax=Halorarius litoreus TaxID=2962676 RepID=UPI0020CD029A|nr:sulfatase-like hydrolase/transferase [Halorarius litoreus]
MTDDGSAGGAVAGAVVSRVVQRLPDSVKRRLAGPYNRVQTARADREFRRRDRESRQPAADAPRHVVCVVVDALRADAVDPATTPFLATRLAGEAITPAPWTFPAVTSLVTGRYPHQHGSMRQSDAADRGATDLVVPPTLATEEPTLPELFAAAGYRTYGAFAFHMPFFALGGRFERHALYDDAPADVVLPDFADWVDDHADERTFSYLHLGDLHEPVEPPESYWERFDVDPTIDGLSRWRFRETPDPGPEGERYRDHRRRLYRAAAAYVDDRLAALHDRLPADVALLVTADHGEALWEHAAFDAETFVDSRPAYGIDHGGTPYEAIARVPLVTDGLDLRLDGAPASLVDVAPTLLDTLGCEDALPATGSSLLRGVPEDRIPLVEACRYGHEKKAAYVDDWKLVVSRGDDAAVGFSLPDEEPTDLPEDVEARLFEALPAWPDGEHPERRVSGMAQQRLEDLGYV